MNIDADLEDTLENAPAIPVARRTTDRQKARQMRESPTFKNLRKKFRDDSSVWRDPATGKQGKPCHLCGDSIDYRLPYGHPEAFELDHIIPVKDRPDLLLDVNNFGASHHTCNEDKGSDAAPLKLGECSEIW
jgi:hypothetical protein